MTFHIDNRGGLLATPLLKICSGKMLRRTRVKIADSLLLINNVFFFIFVLSLFCFAFRNIGLSHQTYSAESWVRGLYIEQLLFEIWGYLLNIHFVITLQFSARRLSAFCSVQTVTFSAKYIIGMIFWYH